jgi:hypothetical protein
MLGHPRTIPQAVAFLKSKIPADTLHLIRGAEPFDPVEFHFSLGMWVRGELGLWNEGSPLLRACNTTCADSASGVILMALWEDLVRTATPEEMARSRGVRRSYDEERAREKQAHMDGVALKDAQITTERCPFCGKPCPSYRKTCKHCHRQVREPSSSGDPAAT